MAAVCLAAIWQWRRGWLAATGWRRLAGGNLASRGGQLAAKWTEAAGLVAAIKPDGAEHAGGV